ncbi:MAG: hypothetical protein U5Q44_10240 [Dehalococcoidia bacterium]|nr:hypothetical protein [Dehalococcoidia bacterium]
MKEAPLEGQDGDEKLRALMHIGELHRQSGEEITKFQLHPGDWDQLSQAPGAAAAIDIFEGKLLGAECDVADTVPQGTVYFEVRQSAT